MAKDRQNTLSGGLRTLFQIGTTAASTDRELLDRFLNHGGELAQAAIGVLIERHGPMVLRVCRSRLSDEHDAQDAFQATFLVLVRRARSIRDRDSIGSWLHGVALRGSRTRFNRPETAA